jgi:hypothetical protein
MLHLLPNLDPYHDLDLDPDHDLDLDPDHDLDLDPDHGLDLDPILNRFQIQVRKNSFNRGEIRKPS